MWRKIRRRVRPHVRSLGLLALFLAGIVLGGVAFSTLAPTYDDIYAKIVKIELKGAETGKTYTWTGQTYSKTIDRGKWFHQVSGPGSSSSWIKYTNPIITVEVGSIWSVADKGKSERTASDGTKYKIYEWEAYWELRIHASGWLLRVVDGEPGKWEIDYWNNWYSWGCKAYGVPEGVTVTVTLQFSATWSGWRFGKAWCADVVETKFWKTVDGDHNALKISSDGTLTTNCDEDWHVELEADPVEPKQKGDLINAYYSGNPDNALSAPKMNGVKLVISAKLSPGFVINVDDGPGAPDDAHAHGEAEVIVRYRVRIWATEKIDPEGGGGEETEPDPEPDNGGGGFLEWLNENPWAVMVLAVLGLVFMGMVVSLVGPVVRGVGAAAGQATQRAAQSRVGAVLVFGLFLLMVVVVLVFGLWWVIGSG